jgi:CheY-like chemotaxis protein
VDDRRHLPFFEPARETCEGQAEMAEDAELLVDDSRGLVARDWLGWRQRVDVDRGIRGRRSTRRKEREESACEPDRARSLEVEVERLLASPETEQKIVVAVDDHRRIVGIDLSRSGLMRADPLRVVVAEDDDQLAELITSLLTDDDRFEVVGRARTGDEAVELAGEHRPDIVVMDLAMPGCDGVEATRLIRALNAEQHVVIYTGSGDYGDVKRAEDAGAAGYLHKDAVTSGEIGDALDVLHRNYLRGDDTVEA